MTIFVPILCACATTLIAFLVLLFTSSAHGEGALLPVLLQSLLIGIAVAVYVYFRMASERIRGTPPQPDLGAAKGSSPSSLNPDPKQATVNDSERRPLSVQEKEELGRELKARFDELSANRESFGKLRRDLVFQNPLPLSEPEPADLPEGCLCAPQDPALRRHRWADGRFSFTFEGKLVPVGVYKRERVTISRTKETESTEGYAWRAEVPSLEELLGVSSAEFKVESDGKLVARLFKDEVVRSTGLTTYLYLILDKTRASLEIQYYHDFDGE